MWWLRSDNDYAPVVLNVRLFKFKRATGHPYPHMQVAAKNYTAVPRATGGSEEQIEATLREKAPDFCEFGSWKDP